MKFYAKLSQKWPYQNSRKITKWNFRILRKITKIPIIVPPLYFLNVAHTPSAIFQIWDLLSWYYFNMYYNFSDSCTRPSPSLIVTAPSPTISWFLLHVSYFGVWHFSIAKCSSKKSCWTWSATYCLVYSYFFLKNVS